MPEIFNSAGTVGLHSLPEEATVHIDSKQLEWQDCGADGFLIKPLMELEDQAIRSWLMKVEPGAFSSMHAHDEIEQIYVLEGSFYDQDRTYRAGEFIVRAPGAMHTAGSDTGAIVILVYV